jgi:hypothetical protein
MDKNMKVSNQNDRTLPDDTINANVTALPKDRQSPDQIAAEPDLAESTPMDYGDMNLKDAQESGYTDKDGKAISKAKKDVTGSPTGAYTDIGAGRSSVVHKADEKGFKH